MTTPPATGNNKINPVVFYTSAGLILLFALTTILYSDLSAAWILKTVNWVSATFGLVLHVSGSLIYGIRPVYCRLTLWLNKTRARTIKTRV